MKFENGEICGEMENREVIKRARNFFQLKFDREKNLKWNWNFSHEEKNFFEKNSKLLKIVEKIVEIVENFIELWKK